MFCPKCGTEILSDSLFCNKCGNKVVEGEIIIESNKPRKKGIFNYIKKLAMNKTTNGVILVVCVILAIVCFNVGKDNLPKIENRSELVRISKEGIDLSSSSIYLYSYKSDWENKLKQYQTEYAQVLSATIIGYSLSAVFSVLVIYYGYHMVIILKKRGNKDVL